jgi:hypothetical protein
VVGPHPGTAGASSALSRWPTFDWRSEAYSRSASV